MCSPRPYAMSNVWKCVLFYLQQSNMQNWWCPANMILPGKCNADKISKQRSNEEDDASSDDSDDKICDFTSDGHDGE